MSIYKSAPSYAVRIHNAQTLGIIQDVVNFESFTWGRHIRDMKEFTLEVGEGDIDPDAISYNNVITFMRAGQVEFAGIIRQYDYIFDERKWTLTGFDLKWHLKSRLVVPTSGSYDSVISTNAETAMRYYVEHHLGSSASDDSKGARDLNEYLDGATFELAPIDYERGGLVTYTARYQNLLTDVLAEIGEASGLFFDIVVDLNSSPPKYQFVVYDETDVSTLQAANDQVVFGSEFGNATDTVFTVDRTGEFNVAYVLGPESSGVPRAATLESTRDHVHPVEIHPSHFRIESAYDARNADTTTERHDLAHNAMHRSVAQRLRSTPFDVPAVSGYRVEWDLGYHVTISMPRVGIEQHLPVTGISGTYNASDGESISVDFGAEPRQLEDILSENFRQYNNIRFSP